jgi:hypothetical protein
VFFCSKKFGGRAAQRLGGALRGLLTGRLVSRPNPTDYNVEFKKQIRRETGGS